VWPFITYCVQYLEGVVASRMLAGPRPSHAGGAASEGCGGVSHAGGAASFIAPLHCVVASRMLVAPLVSLHLYYGRHSS